jgi:hypothetical protein
MNIVSYTVDKRRRSHPTVTVVALLDSKEESPQLVAVDDEARAICVMVPDPEWNGTGPGLMASGEIILAEMESFVTKRLGQNLDPNEQVKVLRAVEDARALKLSMDAGAAAALAQKTALEAEIAALEAKKVEVKP